MNLYGLIVFHHVAVMGSVTKAAEELRISQPAVTAHVRNLSHELGLTLLAPRGRGILLTAAGERVAAHAARVAALERDIKRDVDAFRSGESGVIRIAATSLPANFLLPGWLMTFREAYPSVVAKLVTGNARDARRALLHYEADLAVIGGSSEEFQGLSHRLLLEDELWFVVPAAHPLAGLSLALSSMIEQPFVMRETGSAAMDRLLSLCRVRGVRQPTAVLKVDGVQETVRHVAAGFGAAYVSSLEAKDAAARGEIARVDVTDAKLVNPIVLVWRADDPLPPIAAHFARQITGDGTAF
ncbi:LysR substrate-binding domain-containing protein [Paenibacillus mendelii]|uniref:LysR substrate-binding domain-containing protein n=1 Tax=Paenibacillus mendelii TaxID=206163 RepID=A0ABV6JG61_9BACL|nr:LysR family transcriptional regulator [Paenibacillus mendelii]MCQ6557787.1 LysR family transcriptional regulator [Paenibacillus mendelii]